MIEERKSQMLGHVILLTWWYTQCFLSLAGVPLWFMFIVPPIVYTVGFLLPKIAQLLVFIALWIDFKTTNKNDE